MTLLFYTVIDALAVILLYLQEKWYNGRNYGFTLNPFFVKKVIYSECCHLYC